MAKRKKINHDTTCFACGGEGSIVGDKCYFCNGTGHEKTKFEMDLEDAETMKVLLKLLSKKAKQLSDHKTQSHRDAAQGMEYVIEEVERYCRNNDMFDNF